MLDTTATAVSEPIARPTSPDGFRRGDAVVHLEQGLGRYEGLTRIATDSVDGEFMTVRYADDARLHVPVGAARCLAALGAEITDEDLDTLGSKRWSAARRRAGQSLCHAAQALFEARARRALLERTPYPIDDAGYRRFADSFGFEPTDDQQRAIDEVIEDLQGSRPMDRLVCGDVGFGKTEVALRAVWIAAKAGRQVALLVPTTLLATQHHRTVIDRFQDSELRTGILTRLDDKPEQLRVREAVAAGEIDVLIGTHALLGDEVAFDDLGLVVIDEEHRFGARQTEHMSALRDTVDVLTLTATPIPRSLHMSLHGLRDVSVIRTPPQHRRAVRTVITERDDRLIERHIGRELERGGQAYFLHNRVESLDEQVECLSSLHPEAVIECAHGQMPEEELAATMQRFDDGNTDILVATTIIENGIDVPNANTLVVDGAQRLGLAQLHQLRGRVGRADRQAVALLMTDPAEPVSDESRIRLTAMSECDHLGAGFDLAQRDLALRGAGELLGQEQSGGFLDIGPALYARLLRRAVGVLERGGELDSDQGIVEAAEVDLGLPAFFPEDFIDDEPARLAAYASVAFAADTDELDRRKAALLRDVGALPAAAWTLFETSRLRLRCERLGVGSCSIDASGGRIVFAAGAATHRQAVEAALSGPGRASSWQDDGSVTFSGAFEKGCERVDALDRVLDALQ